MDKFAKCHLGLAGTLLLGIAVIAVAGVKKSGLAAVLAFLVMGLLGAVLAAQYKMETYRVIGEQSPGGGVPGSGKAAFAPGRGGTAPEKPPLSASGGLAADFGNGAVFCDASDFERGVTHGIS